MFICLKSVFISIYLIFTICVLPSFLNLFVYSYKKFRCQVQVFHHLIFQSSDYITLFSLLSAVQSHINLISFPWKLKGDIFFSLDKTVPVTTAFDLKGTILCLCSNARRGVIKSDLLLGERKQRPGQVIPGKYFPRCRKHFFYLRIIVLSQNLTVLLTAATQGPQFRCLMYTPLYLCLSWFWIFFTNVILAQRSIVFHI